MLRDIPAAALNRAGYTASVADIKKRYPPNQYDFSLPSDNLTLLHIAAVHDALECFIALTNKSCNLRAQSAASYLPLHYACLGNSLEVALYILTQDRDQASLPEPGPPHSRLSLAAEARSLRIIRLLIRHARGPLPGVGHATRVALRTRDVDCLRELVRLELPGEEETTPLIEAIRHEAWDAVPLLIEAGVDVDFQSKRTGECALGMACEVAPPKTVGLIADKMANVDPPDRKFPGPIQYICCRRDPEIADKLLSKQIWLLRPDKNGYHGPWNLLRAKKPEDAIRILEKVVNAGYDVNVPDEKGFTLLERAFQYPLRGPAVTEIVKWLVAHGADIGVGNLKSRRPIDYIMADPALKKACHLEIEKFLASGK
jgi:ankyrin repeat protein